MDILSWIARRRLAIAASEIGRGAVGVGIEFSTGLLAIDDGARLAIAALRCSILILIILLAC
jgi:hypothetical protein